MPMFAYTAKDAAGRPKADIIEAASEQVLVDTLQAQGFFVVSVQPAESAVRQSSVKKSKAQDAFTHSQIKSEDTIAFARQLGAMLEAGVTLLRSLDVIMLQIASRDFARIVKEVCVDVEQGKSFSASLARHPKVFNQFWVSLVEVGEASGTMPLVLEKLTFYIEQQAAFRSMVVSALIYPCVLFFVSIGAVTFFALFVTPRFESIFASMHTKLPLFTVMLLTVFHFVKIHFYFLVGAVVALFLGVRQYIKTNHGRLVFEQMLFNLPVFGDVYKLIVVERFSSQMAILVESGVPILYVLEITERLVENRTCSLIVADIREGVREGKLLADTMSVSDFFPPMAVQMIKVGEETGDLGKMLKHVSIFYQKNVETFMKRFGVLVEPVMLVVMGAIIGSIVIAMFLPLFSLTG